MNTLEALFLLVTQAKGFLNPSSYPTASPATFVSRLKGLSSPKNAMLRLHRASYSSIGDNRIFIKERVSREPAPMSSRPAPTIFTDSLKISIVAQLFALLLKSPRCDDEGSAG